MRSYDSHQANLNCKIQYKKANVIYAIKFFIEFE